jgi:biotin operon repressor
MSFVVDAIEDVSDVIFDAADWVIDKVIDPVMTVVSNVIESALDNPVKTIAQIAAIATGNVWALPLIEGASVAADGGDLGDVLKATAIAYVAQNVGQSVGKAVGNYVSNAGTALEYGVSQGSQQAAMLAAQEAGMQTASQIAGRVIGSAAASASVAVVTGQDPVKAFVTGGVGAAVPTILGKVPGFTTLPPSSQQVIAQAVKTQLAGGNVTAAIIGSAIQTSGIVTDVLKKFDPDGTKMTDAQRAIATDVLMGSATAALTGQSIPKAMQNAIMQNGVKALGDMISSGFKTSVDGVATKFTAADKAADAVDVNIAQQEKVAQDYNAVVADLNTRVAEQDRLKSAYDNAVAAQKANPTQATTDAANAAARTYNDYVTKLNADYTNTIQPKINQYAGELAKIQETYGNLEQVYTNAMKGVADAAEAVKKELRPAMDASNKAFVEVMAPNFNADEYRKINNLGANDDPYEHWLSKGQFEGVKTNNKDVAVQAAVDKYEAATKEPIPSRVREAMTRPENQNRDKAIQQYVDASLKDRQTEQSFRDSVANAVLDAYEAEGFSQAQIDEKINSGEARRYIDGAIQRKQESIAQMQEYTKATAEKYGADSTEYKNAYRDTLSAMADVGGYGVVKDGDSFVLPEAGKLDSSTLRPSANEGGGYGYVDPVTGRYTVEIWMKNREGRDISSLWALGQSAKPPTQGGDTVFGDGSGVSSGLFGGIMPVAIDDGRGDAGAKMYGGGNGFALITYSDGRGAAINTNTQEVIWVSPADVQKLLNELPEPKPPLPVTPKPDALVPEKPVVVDPVKDTTQQIKDKIQSPQEVVEALKAAGYTATLEEAKQLAGEKTPEQLRAEAAAYADPRMVDEGEVKAAYEALGLKKPTADDVKKLLGQYDESGLTAKATDYLPTARYNSIMAQLDEMSYGGISQEARDAIDLVRKDLTKSIADTGLEVAKVALKVDNAKADLEKAIKTATSGLATPADVDKAIANIKFPAGLSKEDVSSAIKTYMEANPGLSLADVASKIGEATKGLATSEGVKTEIAAALKTTEGRFDTVDKAIQDLRDAGLTADDVRATVDKIVGSAGTDAAAATGIYAHIDGVNTKIDNINNLIGAPAEGDTAATGLYAKIAANEAAGMKREEATQKAIEDVAKDLGTTKADLLKELGVTEGNLTRKIEGLETALSATEKKILDKVAEYEKAGLTRDEATQKAIATVATDLGTTKADLLKQLGTTEANLTKSIDTLSKDVGALSTKLGEVETNLLAKIEANEEAGLTREQATQKAVADLATELGTTKADVLKQIGATETTLNTKITDLQTQVGKDIKALETNLLAKIEANEEAGLTREQATQKAVADLATELGTSRADVLKQIGATEANLTAKIAGVSTDLQTKYDALTAEQKALATQLTNQGIDLNTAIATVKGEVQTQIGNLQNVVGRGTQQATQTDLDAVINLLQTQGAYDAQYDYNGDRVIDQKDKTAIETYLKSTQPGYKPDTEDPFTYNPAAGSKWASTGVFRTIEEEAAATRQAAADEAGRTRQEQAARVDALSKANAAQALKTQRTGNLNNLMNMLGQAEDTGGQQVTVKAADPAKIGYVYDFNSIFANPSQEKMFVSPYAEGGMVDGSEDVNDELLKILKG